MVELVDAPHSKCGTFGFVGSSPTAPTALMETYQRFPLTLIRGKGCWLWDDCGERYLDAVAGIATCTLGHSDDALRRALTHQLNKLQHVSNLYQIKEQEEFAAWLVEKSCADKVFFCNSGAEANEAAIKLSRKYGHLKKNIKNPIILTAKASFHGRTLATISATGQQNYHKGFEPMVKGFEFFNYNDLTSFKALIEKLEADSPQIASVIIEPLQGEGGVNPGHKNFFKSLREICTKRKILLIFDEVQTGFGRTGTWWGYEQLGIDPDAFTIAKGMGGGHAIGALMVKQTANIFKPGDHASTFGGNPFACKAGITVGREIERRKLLCNVIKRGKELSDGLHNLQISFPKIIKETRGWGLIRGLQIQEESTINAKAIVEQAIKHKLLIVSAGQKVIRIVPPLIIKEREIKQILIRLEMCIRDLT